MVSDNKVSINNKWLFKALEDKDYEVVNIPHTNKEVPYNYFDEKDYQFISCYKKSIYPKDKSKRIFLNFEGVMTAFNLKVNGNLLGEYRGGYIPHFIEITNHISFLEENEIYLEVDSREREDIPPFGYVVDYLTFGGVYRDVFLYELNHCFIENILYSYEVSDFNGDKGNIILRPRVLLNNDLEEIKGSFKVEIQGYSQETELKVMPGRHWYDLKEVCLRNMELWNIDNPKLYNAQGTLWVNGDLMDKSTITLGFRDLKIDEKGFCINGSRVKIRGLNRHQSFPYAGYAMPKRAQIKDADILKDELGLNLARTSHYPQSPYFLERCDEIGLLVLEEIPGWQHVSKEAPWREQALKDLESMIMRDYNHPSIITWGVRINESSDDDELYTKTNNLARELDSSRPTCGIRCIEKSNLLEDIYSMNDFIHDGGEKVLRSRRKVTNLEKPVPYLVTEFCGHIFPTKKFDNEQRLVEHALRHGSVQSLVREKDEYMGAIGWCAFDYYTHFDFGSGDRICYHGVMDMFRLPKYAANLYKSQKELKEEVVLEPLTWWSRGERDKGLVFPIYVCTNCEEIEVILGGKTLGLFKREEENIDEKLAFLKYPPIKLSLSNGDWGSKWSEAEFIGYSHGKKVIAKKFVENPIFKDIAVSIDDDELCGKEFDTTRVVIKAIDQQGNILPYINGSIHITLQGDIEVIGPKHISLIGGSIAFWIKTLGDYTKESAKIKISSSFGIEKEITVKLKEIY